eukprot:5751375-Prymnesium_polylepis.2
MDPRRETNPAVARRRASSSVGAESSRAMSFSRNELSRTEARTKSQTDARSGWPDSLLFLAAPGSLVVSSCCAIVPEPLLEKTPRRSPRPP